MIVININKNMACIKCNERLTSGMVGAQCAFSFDAEWTGLVKTAVFIAGTVQKDVLLTSNECVIPWEVLEKPGYQLYIGVYGVNGNGDLVIPTVYANVGNILPGADPSGDESTDPTLPVWAQLQAGLYAVTAKLNAVDDGNGNITIFGGVERGE